jgi:hypothetical protein
MPVQQEQQQVSQVVQLVVEVAGYWVSLLAPCDQWCVSLVPPEKRPIDKVQPLQQ